MLAEAAISDLILRLSDEPRLVSPRWTDEIWAETRRTYVEKLGWDPSIADSRISAAKETFPEATVTDYAHLIEQCKNDPEDRHVLAAAIKAKSEAIVTFDTKHFRPAWLDPWGIVASHPAEFLKSLYDIDSATVTAALNDMAVSSCRSLSELLGRLAWYAKPFSEHVANAEHIAVTYVNPKDWRRSRFRQD